MRRSTILVLLVCLFVAPSVFGEEDKKGFERFLGHKSIYDHKFFVGATFGFASYSGGTVTGTYAPFEYYDDDIGGTRQVTLSWDSEISTQFGATIGYGVSTQVDILASILFTQQEVTEREGQIVWRTDSESVISILFGARYTNYMEGPISPYLQGGIWIPFSENSLLSSSKHGWGTGVGAVLGGGLKMKITKWLSINLEGNFMVSVVEDHDSRYAVNAGPEFSLTQW